MSFTSFTKKTLILAEEVNDNYLHVRQGNWMPLGGDNLDETTSVYNIGSDLYKWDTAYINNVYAGAADIGTVNDSLILIDSYTIDENNTATSRIEFTGLNGDENEFYHVSFYDCDQSTASKIYLNGDSNTSNYSYIRLNFNSTNVVVNYSSTSNPYFGYAGYTSTVNCSFSFANIHARQRANQKKKIFIDNVRMGDLETRAIEKRGIRWNNTTDTLTSIVFTGEFNTGASIKIWGTN